LPETRPIAQKATISENFRLKKADVEKLVNIWKIEKNLGAAADLLNFSHIEEFKDLLIEPAQFLTSADYDLPKVLKDLALSIVKTEVPALQKSDSQEGLLNSFRQESSNLKKRLIIDPKNSIALIDLARLYAAQGQNEKAREAVLKAVYLKPNHRFILRSAARFFVHNKQSDEAEFILAKSGSTNVDPWLMATHISLETILGKTPKLLKKANLIIKAKSINPIHLSELASSIATFEAFRGDIKSAKRNFNSALIAPNDNSLAQAIWAAQKFSMQINIKDEWLLSPFSHEARYYQFITNAEFEAAITEAREWFLDEPYTLRPLRAAIYLACVLGNYEDAERIARQALKFEKQDIELQNNLIYALAAQSKIEQAVSMLEEIVKVEKNVLGFNGGHTLANWGMIQFKLSNFEEGEKFYKLAISQYEKDGNFLAKSQAAAYMARESVFSKNPNSERILRETLSILKIHPSKLATKILEMSKLIDRKEEKLEDLTRNWHYDEKRKLLILEKSRLK